MADFGNETATAVFNAQTKVLEGIFKLMSFMVARYENKKRETKNVKSNTHVGYTRMKKLMESGENIIPVNFNTPLTKNQFREFSFYAKKAGLEFSATRDKINNNEYILFIKNRDLEVAKMITDKMTENLKLENAQQIDNLETREKTIESILKDGTTKYNDMTGKIIFDDVCNQMKEKSLSLDHVCNRFTDRNFATDKPTYACERTNPNNYIEFNYSLDTFKGTEYTRTDFTVYKNNKNVGKFNDARFEGRPKDYWNNVKNNIREVGNFTDDMVIFSTKEDLDRYREIYNEKIASQTPKETVVTAEFDNESFRDYDGILNQLKAQQREHNIMNNPVSQGEGKLGKMVYINSNEEIKPYATLTERERYHLADATNISRQILNYEKMNYIENELAKAKTQYKSNEYNKPFDDDMVNVNEEFKNQFIETQNKLKQTISEHEMTLQSCKEYEQVLINERKQIAGVYAEMLTEQSSMDLELTHGEEIHDIDSRTSLKDKKEAIKDYRENTSVNNVQQAKNITKGMENTNER